jgi:autotransporter-associated beta strand protein
MKFCSTINSHRPSRRLRRSAFEIAIQTVALATLLTSQSAFATDKSWTGASSTAWGTSNNWSPSGAPAAADNAVFSSVFSRQPRLTANATAGGLWMKTGIGQNVTVSAGSTSYILTLNGNTINGISGLGIYANNTSASGLTISGNTKLGDAQTWRNDSSGVLNINGAVNLNGKALTLQGSGNTVISGAMSGTGESLIKNGGGTATLRGANTYIGTTSVYGGTLIINGNQSTATGAVTVTNTGSTLGGIGTTGATVRVNSAANIAPGDGGNTSGILSTGAVTLASGANFVVHINGPTAGSEYSQLHVQTGGATITGSHLVLKIGAGLTVGQTFKILNKSATGAITGTFAQGSSIASGGYTFSVNYAGGDGNDIVLTVTETPIITTVVGSGPRFLGNNGAATNAGLGQLASLAYRGGNLYICDVDHHIVVKIASGIATIVAGNEETGSSGDGGPATSAALQPTGVVFDSSGNMYIADEQNGYIRKVTTGGTISTFAGCTSRPPNSPWCDINTTPVEGVLKTNTFIEARGIAIDSANNIYVTDAVHHKIRKIRTDGTVWTVAGNGTEAFSGDGGLAIHASIWASQGGLALDASRNLYFTDLGRVRKVTASNGIINTIAGPSEFGAGRDLFVDGAGNVFVTDLYTNQVKKIATNGSVTTVIGTGAYGFSGDGGPATSATFKNVFGLTKDTSGNIYVADRFNYRVRKVTVSTGIINTFAGSGRGNFWGDGGSATSAGLDKPSSVAFDTSGNMYIADTYNNRVRKVTTGGIISTFAGIGLPGYSGDGGAATSAKLNEPTSVAADSNGNVFVADSVNNVVRKITPAGVISTYAGGGVSLGDGGPATMAQLQFGFQQGSIALDRYNTLYIADMGNVRVRKVGTNGIINTIAGNGVNAYSGDGGLATSASLLAPSQVSVAGDGSIYISSMGFPSQLRRIKQGIISRVAGDFGARGCTCIENPGTTLATDVSFESIINAAFNSSGSVFIGCAFSQVTVVAPNNTIYYLVNTNGGYSGFSGDGGPALTALIAPGGLATDAAGNLYIADYGNDRIRKVWLH